MPTTPIAAAGVVPTLAYDPLVLHVLDRARPLHLKITAPVDGQDLPVLLLSHGHGASNFLASGHGYGPLADYWASHGFVVVQPTHLDANELGLRGSELPDAPLFWRDRALDMHHVLDHLHRLDDVVPGLAGRVDRNKVVAVGHSLGGHTVGLLLGMQVLDPGDDREKDLSDHRIRAGVLIGAPGMADEHLGRWAAEHYPSLRYIDYTTMTGTALVVAGDRDLNPLFSDRLSYRWDAHTRSPGDRTTLLTVHGAEHMFGGISGYDASETTDEDPSRVEALRELILAYLQSELDPDDAGWAAATDALRRSSDPFASVDDGDGAARPDSLGEQSLEPRR